MTVLKELLKCVALAALCVALSGGAVCLYRLPKIVNQQIDATRSELLASEHIAETDANTLLADATAKASQRLTDALSLMDRRSEQALQEVHLASQNADLRTGQALAIVAGAAKDSNTQMSILNATVASTLKPVTETAQQIDDAGPLWLDCEFNPDCAFNRYQGTAKAFEQTARVIAAEAPKMSISADKIAASSAGVAASADSTGKEVAIAAKRFNAPQTKWQAFRSWLLTIARIYGAI